MAFYPVAFPFLLAFSLLSGEVVTRQCKRDDHIWICQYDSCLFLFLMSTTCLTLTEGLFPRSVLTSKSLSRETVWIATFLVRQEGIRLLAVGVLWALLALAWWTNWEKNMITAEWMMAISFCLCVIWESQLFSFWSCILSTEGYMKETKDWGSPGTGTAELQEFKRMSWGQERWLCA